jgi:dethiobiotin synthetase
MRVFITGTDTGIGKTLVCSWLCAHTGFDYFKPIQTGFIEGCDKDVVRHLSQSRIHPETYAYQAPVSPHQAAMLEQDCIELSRITTPAVDHLIIEGAGGVLVPINATALMVDLMKQFKMPVILVASSRLGTINHTLLSIEALRARSIPLLGVIVSGEPNLVSCDAIAHYGQVSILAQLPFMPEINNHALMQHPLSAALEAILGVNAYVTD